MKIWVVVVSQGVWTHLSWCLAIGTSLAFQTGLTHPQWQLPKVAFEQWWPTVPKHIPRVSLNLSFYLDNCEQAMQAQGGLSLPWPSHTHGSLLIPTVIKGERCFCIDTVTCTEISSCHCVKMLIRQRWCIQRYDGLCDPTLEAKMGVICCYEVFGHITCTICAFEVAQDTYFIAYFISVESTKTLTIQ